MPNQDEVTETVFLNEFARLTPTWRTVLAKRIYDALVASDEFRIVYRRQPSRAFAEFWRGDDEVCRAEVGLDHGAEQSASSMWICKRRGSGDQDWTASRKADFESRFGFRANAGHRLSDWCVDNSDRVEELTRWLIAQAVGEEQADAVPINIDTNPPGESP